MDLKQVFGAGSAIVKVSLGKKIPLRVTHITTNVCNLKCKYCYAEAFARDGEMTTEQIKNMMLEFKKAGTKIWKFSGGEPLLKKDIGEIVNFGKKCGFILNMDTNGTLVEKNLGILKEIDNVQLSIDGPEKVHDAIRGKGVFKKCMDSLELFKKNGINPLINCVISKNNLDYVDFMANLAKEKKAFINFQPVVPVTPEAREELSREMIERRIFDRILELKKTNKYLAVSDESMIRFKQFYSGEIKKFQKKCLAGKIYCVISPYGKVARCIDELGTKNVDGLKHGFVDALNMLSKDYSCDCTFCCYYDLSNTYSFNPKRNVKAAINLIRGRWIYH